MVRRILLIFTFLFPLLGGTALAAEDVIDKGDTAWLIVATALVMLMTPGLALFYGGMARRKNVLNTIMFSFLILGLISWWGTQRPC